MMCRISSESINDIRDSERTGENCLFKIRSDRLGYPERGNKGQDMDEGHCCDSKESKRKKIWSYRYRTSKQLMLASNGTCIKINFCPFCGYSYQPERLRRVDAEKRSDSLNSTNE